MTDRVATLREDWPSHVQFSRAWVGRAIDEAFGPETRNSVRKAIERVEPSADDRGRSRLQLAIVRLSEGDPLRVDALVDEAERDYRDVLVRAEYEKPTRPLSAEVSTDYLEWLTRLSGPAD